MLRFFLGWIADLESYFSMQKYSQVASKEASTQVAQNQARILAFNLECNTVVWFATTRPWWALSMWASKACKIESISLPLDLFGLVEASRDGPPSTFM